MPDRRGVLSEQLGFDLLELVESAASGSTSSSRPGRRRSKRQPPMVRCGCGRLHPSWNPRKKCRECVARDRDPSGAVVHARVVEAERRRVAPTDEERAEDRAAFSVIHTRWLARQSLDHPWRVAAAGGEA